MTKLNDLIHGKAYPAIVAPLDCNQWDKKTGTVKTVYYGKVKTSPLTGVFTEGCPTIEAANAAAEKLLEEMKRKDE